MHPLEQVQGAGKHEVVGQERAAKPPPPRLDPPRALHLALPRQQRHPSHLQQVEPDRIIDHRGRAAGAGRLRRDGPDGRNGDATLHDGNLEGSEAWTVRRGPRRAGAARTTLSIEGARPMPKTWTVGNNLPSGAFCGEKPRLPARMGRVPDRPPCRRWATRSRGVSPLCNAPASRTQAGRPFGTKSP